MKFALPAAFGAALLPGLAFAQGPASPPQPGQPDIVYASDADLAAAIAMARADRPSDQPTGRPVPLVRIAGYRALVEFRSGPTPPMIHDRDAEFISVLDGNGTLIIGGTLDNAVRTNPANQRGTSISNGTPRALTKGTTIFLPPGTPHYFARVGKDGLSVLALHIPPGAPVPAGKP